MTSTSRLIRTLRPFLRRHPGIKGALRNVDEAVSRLHHSAAERVPSLIQPKPRQLTVAITANCNLRCDGCRYGRDFMPGELISLDTMRGVLDDAHAANIHTVRYYGGEPMLHPDLPRMLEHSNALGMNSYITTNGILLERRIDELYDAGLRWMTIGFYGVGEEYDEYTGRPGHFAKLERGLSLVRERYGDEVQIQINFLLYRKSCNLESWRRAWEFAERFGLCVYIDLISYSIPYFTSGEGEDLEFEPEHRPRIDEVTSELVRMKEQHPERFSQSLAFMRSIPDWLLRGAEMRVPCDAYQLVWIGADGSVQLCDVHFKLGNVNETPLREILFKDAHKEAARDGFQLKCPNCTCKLDSRIRKHAASWTRYSR